eukprot:g2261.t1
MSAENQERDEDSSWVNAIAGELLVDFRVLVGAHVAAPHRTMAHLMQSKDDLATMFDVSPYRCERLYYVLHHEEASRKPHDYLTPWELLSVLKQLGLLNLDGFGVGSGGRDHGGKRLQCPDGRLPFAASVARGKFYHWCNLRRRKRALVVGGAGAGEVSSGIDDKDSGNFDFPRGGEAGEDEAGVPPLPIALPAAGIFPACELLRADADRFFAEDGSGRGAAALRSLVSPLTKLIGAPAPAQKQLRRGAQEAEQDQAGEDGELFHDADEDADAEAVVGVADKEADPYAEFSAAAREKGLSPVQDPLQRIVDFYWGYAVADRELMVKAYCIWQAFVEPFLSNQERLLIMLPQKKVGDVLCGIFMQGLLLATERQLLNQRLFLEDRSVLPSVREFFDSRPPQTQTPKTRKAPHGSFRVFDYTNEQICETRVTPSHPSSLAPVVYQNGRSRRDRHMHLRKYLQQCNEQDYLLGRAPAFGDVGALKSSFSPAAATSSASSTTGGDRVSASSGLSQTQEMEALQNQIILHNEARPNRWICFETGKRYKGSRTLLQLGLKYRIHPLAMEDALKLLEEHPTGRINKYTSELTDLTRRRDEDRVLTSVPVLVESSSQELMSGKRCDGEHWYLSVPLFRLNHAARHRVHSAVRELEQLVGNSHDDPLEGTRTSMRHRSGQGKARKRRHGFAGKSTSVASTGKAVLKRAASFIPIPERIARSLSFLTRSAKKEGGGDGGEVSQTSGEDVGDDHESGAHETPQQDFSQEGTRGPYSYSSQTQHDEPSKTSSAQTPAADSGLLPNLGICIEAARIGIIVNTKPGCDLVLSISTPWRATRANMADESVEELELAAKKKLDRLLLKKEMAEKAARERESKGKGKIKKAEEASTSSNGGAVGQNALFTEDEEREIVRDLTLDLMSDASSQESDMEELFTPEEVQALTSERFSGEGGAEGERASGAEMLRESAAGSTDPGADARKLSGVVGEDLEQRPAADGLGVNTDTKFMPVVPDAGAHFAEAPTLNGSCDSSDTMADEAQEQQAARLLQKSVPPPLSSVFREVVHSLTKSYSMVRSNSAMWVVYAILDAGLSQLSPIAHAFELQLAITAARLHEKEHALPWAEVKNLYLLERHLDWFEMQVKPLDRLLKGLIAAADERTSSSSDHGVHTPTSDSHSATAQHNSPSSTSPIVSKELKGYLEDTQDMLNELLMKLESYQRECESLKAEREAYVDASLNRLLTTLTIITAIVLPVTVFSGYGGMNFVDEDGDPQDPWLTHENGYHIWLGIAGALTLVLGVFIWQGARGLYN